MSSFTCPTCDAPHIDMESSRTLLGGYISGCLCNGEGQKCDVCRQEMQLINPDGWLRCPNYEKHIAKEEPPCQP